MRKSSVSPAIRCHGRHGFRGVALPLRPLRNFLAIGAALLAGQIAKAEESPPPTVILKQIVEAMPKGDKQEVQVLVGTIPPGQNTVFHSHPFPVTLYILEGTFTLEMEGRPAATVTAGQSFVEPPNVRMTGHNLSSTETMKAVIFYVGDAGTPFLELLHH